MIVVVLYVPVTEVRHISGVTRILFLCKRGWWWSESSSDMPAGEVIAKLGIRILGRGRFKFAEILDTKLAGLVGKVYQWDV